MNRKGDWFVEEVAKIIVAIILLLLLGYLAFTLYESITQKSQLEQARVHLDNIANIIKELKDGDSQSYLVSSPKDWFLIYIHNSNTQGVPAQCVLNGCLCFCINKKQYFSDTSGDSVYCEKNNICKVIKEANITESAEISNGIQIAPSLVYFSKSDNKLLISSKDVSYTDVKNTFAEFLNFKNTDSQSIEELSTNYLEGSNVKSELNNLLGEYFNSNNLQGSYIIMDLEKQTLIFEYYNPYFPGSIGVENLIDPQRKEVKVNGKDYALIFRLFEIK